MTIVYLRSTEFVASHDVGSRPSLFNSTTFLTPFSAVQVNGPCYHSRPIFTDIIHSNALSVFTPKT